MGFFKNILNKLATGLSKTREQFVGGLRDVLTGKKLSPQLIRDIEQRLIQADVGVKTATELAKDIQAAYERNEMTTGDQALEFLKSQLSAYWPKEDRQLRFPTAERVGGLEGGGRGLPGGRGVRGGTMVILMVGVNGSGKTTSIAKLCHLLRSQGKSVMLAAGDTFRAAAVEQLEIWSSRLDVPVIKGKQGGDPAAVAFDAAEAAISRQVDVLIVDTAGRLHTQDHLMRQLSKIKSVLAKKIPGAPHEVLLVLDATTGQNAVNQAKVFAQAAEVTGIFLSKLDGTAKGGIVVAIREELAIPVKFVGLGETPEDIEPFEPEKFIQAMFAPLPPPPP